MPTPRPVGNVAKSVLINLADLIEENIGTTGKIKHYMHLNQLEDAQNAQEQSQEVQMLVLRVLTSLIVQDTPGAEETLLRYKQGKLKGK